MVLHVIPWSGAVDVDEKALEALYAVEYPINVIADPYGGYVVVYPDLPGCLTQIESLDELPTAATEVRQLWLEAEFERGADIPPPSCPPDYSGKFNVRIPPSLHRSLAESAASEKVSLNQYVLMPLAKGDAEARFQRSLADRSPRVGRFA